MKILATRVYIVIFFIGFVFFVSAQSVSVTSAKIMSAPLDTLENGGEGIGTFSFVESSGTQVSSNSNEGNVKIKVHMEFVVLTNSDLSKVSGSLLEYFDVSYDTALNNLVFNQNSNIPGDWSGFVSFPIKVTQNSTQAELNNGFEVHISSVNSSVNTYGDISVNTYTSNNALLGDTDVILDNLHVYPIPAKEFLHIDVTTVTLLKINIYDAKGLLVYRNTINKKENSVNISALTQGIYYLEVVNPSVHTNNSIRFIKR